MIILIYYRNVNIVFIFLYHDKMYSMQEKCGYTYIITNISNTVLYIGVTSNLQRRIYEHKNKLIEGFSKRYNLSKLVYYEVTQEISLAIKREKFLKSKTRKYKIKLIEEFNPEWKDLYDSIL